jgi:hypothetical protein
VRLAGRQRHHPRPLSQQLVKGGGPHGEGFSSMQDSGINAKASRGVYVKQKPKGVPVGSPLSKCKPSYSLVESG